MIDWRNWTVRQTRVALLAGLVGVPMLAVSAKAAVIAYYAAQAKAEAPPLPPIGYESEDHFPGAALFYVAEEQAAPTAGTTGTTALPDLPIPTNADLTPDTDGTVRPALPFSMAGASALDKARALDCLATAIYYEAASESEEGQRAVAQVILNRVRHPAFPSTVCGVVYQGSEKSTGCQFSYACDGSMARVPMRSAMDRARRFALEALSGYVVRGVGLATHYHTYAVTPAWNRSLVMTDAIGMHFFHRWKGYWGTPAAFSNARYRGGELDLVMLEAGARGIPSVVFVEVRYRSGKDFGDGAASIDGRKQRKLVHAAQLFIASHRQFAHADCRFDVVFADGDPERPNLRWLRDAFRADDP